jgi:hypothetical protein
MPVTSETELAARRGDLSSHEDLQAVGSRLVGLLNPIIERPIFIPEQKALLSQDGGVCPGDGSRLSFDPLSPEQHTCAECGRAYEGERHHRAWIWRYHIWLTERAIHLALLDALGLFEGGATYARTILTSYAARYSTYPNRDNVLGPTRLFFSTYLESIWVVQIVIAASLVEHASREDGFDSASRERVQAMVEESASLIASYDEGWSNRQVWNNTALIAAGRWLGVPAFVRQALEGAHGILAQLEQAVSDEGRWHEGENYHFFALRAFSLAAEFLRTREIDLYNQHPAGDRLSRMYGAPLAVVLPDLTIPARGDSPYGISLLQPRFAELWEQGLRRTDDDRLESVLSAIYGAEAPDAPDVGLEEIAEVEQNRPARCLARRQLGWRALLWMRGRQPDADPDAWQVRSTLVAPSGPAVLRTAPNRYIALECEGTGLGHGHPDRLHLTLYWDGPWFVDFGTGSYVSPLLFWYRSALAHNAPLRTASGQHCGRQAWCSSFAVSDRWSWCRATAPDLLGVGTLATRTVIVGPEYVTDVVDVTAPDDVTVDLPLHPLGSLTVDEDTSAAAVSWDHGPAKSPEHGNDALQDIVEIAPPPERFTAVSGEQTFEIFLLPRERESIFAGRAPGPPTLDFGEAETLTFWVRRAPGTGRWVQVYSASPGLVESVETEGEEVRVSRGEVSETFRLHDWGVEIAEAGRGGAVTSLAGVLPEPEARPPSRYAPAVVRCALLESPPLLEQGLEPFPSDAVVWLGGSQYRRSEEEYPGEHELAAHVGLGACGSALYLAVEVRKPELVFRAADAPDPMLDNEHPDIHADGVEWFIGLAGWCGYLVLPQLEAQTVRIRPVRGTVAREDELRGEWCRTATGYRLLAVYEAGRPLVMGERFAVNTVINEMRPERERRAGQLALAGGGGWVYLRGDRESPDGAAIAEVS